MSRKICEDFFVQFRKQAALVRKGCDLLHEMMQSFDRLDECLPFPIPDNARTVLPIAPDVLGLSQYTLTVTGLKDGDYTLSINGAACGTLSAKALAGGVNLTTLPADPKAKTPNPIAGPA